MYIRRVKPLLRFIVPRCLAILLSVSIGTHSLVAQHARFEGLGNYSRKISTNSKEAQLAFNEGMCFLYSFNHDEARRSFLVAAEKRPRMCDRLWVWR